VCKTKTKSVAARERPGVQEQAQDYYGLGFGLAFAQHYIGVSYFK
jgi:hypothetical protein